MLEGVITPGADPAGAAAGPRARRSRSWCPTPAIRNLIREDKVHQIYSQMQIGQTKYGMQTMNQALYRALSPAG